ncbi:uncharacterized protein LOC123313728 [Coccinella septempunctata]|uniref:uncharacterized protein LOC123313728 n=1 Tax=Coccinella septempunctata TaxID=41139 RepID=UPI001D06D761|nr:uncharacterized protein LOC123313728 [Coccinella septempunctata]
MKFLILALSTIAVASAAFFGGKTVNVLDDGSIVVRTDTGKQIMISKKMGPLGQHVMEIDVTGPFTMGKKIQIDESNQVRVSPGTGTFDMETADLMDRLKRSPKVTTAATQADALAEIMKEFQGIINEAGYEKFLAKLQKSVTKGKLDASVVDYIQNLAETMPWHTVAPTTTTTTGNAQVQYPASTVQGVVGTRQLPWYMCNDIACFKQMMMMNGIYQKAPLMTYDQYMRMNMYNNMRMNPMYNGQMSPMNYHSMYPVNMGLNQGYPIREGAIDTGFVNNDLAARKNFWSTYMNRLNMNSFGTPYDEQQQPMPINREVADNKLYF